MTESMEAKNARNARVSARYDALMAEGKHGHYETLFRVVREEVERAAPEAAEPVAPVAKIVLKGGEIVKAATYMPGLPDGEHELYVSAGQARRDAVEAARYRWLRDVSTPPHNFYLSVPVEFDGVKFGREEVDAAIDAALSSAAAAPNQGEAATPDPSRA